MSTKPKMTLRIVSATVLVCLLGCAAAASAFAAPKLMIRSELPDTAEAGTSNLIFWVQNVGDRATEGPITVVDTFSAPVSKVEPTFGPVLFVGETSSVTPIKVECQKVANSVSCEVNGALQPGVQVAIQAAPTIPQGASGNIADLITVSGGGAVSATEESNIAIGPPGPFGFDSGAAELLNAHGAPDVLAGSVPAEFTTKLRWKSFLSSLDPIFETENSDEFFKEVVAQLPPGLIGNPSASALCTTDELGTPDRQVEVQELYSCPPDSQVGVARVGLLGHTYTTGLFNMVAPYGASAELGFNVMGTVVLLDAYVRPGDHGLNIVNRDTSTSISVSATEITVWGVPADHSHDIYRWQCIGNAGYGPRGTLCPSDAPQQAFLRMPTSCSGAPLAFAAESDSYAHPDAWAKVSFQGPTMAGCDAVPFVPSITVEPTGTATSSPTGVSVKLSLPQSRSPEGLAQADLKKAVVTLPEGMSINPSSADGLQVCDDAHLHLDTNEPAECPNGSKMGTALLHTQLIPNPIEGSIFLRPQNSSDPASGEMFRIALELRDDSHGLDFKVAGHISANPLTGRLTTTFDDNPQFPFEDISLEFKAGARSALATPPTCTKQTTEASLYSWARPDEATLRESSFQLTSGPEGLPCPGATLPFKPQLNAGVSDVEAGAYTSFLATFIRHDSDQAMQGVSVTMPKGLLGSLSSVALCPDGQASAGTCGPDSQIGTVTAGAGVGPSPFYVTGGRVYITGPYKGAPFGLSIVIPTKAGPFDLGTVVVRAKVEMDPYTTQLTVTSDPLPQVVGGVPVDLRLVNVTINRPNFVFNPTDCANSTITGKMTGVQGTTTTLENPFQVTNCAALKFQPRFQVSTSAQTSRQNGDELIAKLSYPGGKPLGTQVNIAKVRVELPEQLPSRLTTLQKACTDRVFEADPAQCPAASRVGFATANTPVLPVPLEGPAYFVSHGGAKFPELDIVLQGYGVTQILRGETFISKAGVTSTTFNTVPDVPIGNFELKLPAGPDSALAANGDLCASKLVMPTTFTAQDGQVVQEDTPVAVEGCSPEIRVIRHSVSGKHATVVVQVPSAGRLVAGGGGVLRATRRVASAGTVTLKLKLSKSEQRFVARHHGRRLRVPINLSFAPSRGGKLKATVAVLMR